MSDHQNDSPQRISRRDFLQRTGAASLVAGSAAGVAPNLPARPVLGQTKNGAAFSGILPAVVTPVDAEGNFLPEALERLLQRLYAAGVHGMYVCGMTGEGPLQPATQRKQVAEVAVKNSPPGKTVIIHVGAYRPAEALELAKHASRLPAHAVASLPPSGNYSFAEIRAYYQALAAVSDLPVLVYYFPDLYPALNTIEQIQELLAIQNVIGLKFTDYNLYRMSNLKQQGHVVFNGKDEVLVAGLLTGADGGIGSIYNLVPDLFLRVYELARTQQWMQAREVQRTINELIDIILRFPSIAAIKKLLTWSGINCGPSLAPRRSLTAVEEAELRSLLAKSSFAHAPFAGQEGK